MRHEERTSTSAKLLYRPIGLTSSIVAGIAAGQVFKQVWKRVSAGEGADAPRALESEYSMKEVLAAAAVQGAIFAVVKALVDRGGARAFQRATGEWPGD
ncbi:hypothetical protein I601_1722 [Nocardioides dokdonensis FR1436]|uniref:DUF4235 domain-containing protein n=1 Tax=Nocardioides dokdonensis FR1436 TaxID=1300347 RepID=A0A1A9GKP4_9ACTN|nr:DUF4235 domain-containing protein [Nocardioides dokdonensis]ANH38153.1 hypothetical protein I601_1722 [Nocardioides dokdonensis FR1436]